MFVKETPWETRNLGVKSSAEFYFESTDTVETLTEEVLRNTTYAYQVAHIPAGKIDILNALLNTGFYFAETKILMSADLNTYTLPEKFKVAMSGLKYHEANATELELIYKKMREGMFDTDKVALDPHFNAQVAGNRYALWTQDEIAAGRCSPFITTYEDEVIGFFMLKKTDNKTGDSFLGGVFDKNNNIGFGFAIIYLIMYEAKKLGLKKIVTGVSSNNLDSVRVHIALGYQVKTLLYTLVKHLEK